MAWRFKYQSVNDRRLRKQAKDRNSPRGGGGGVNKGGGAHFPSGHRLLKAKEPPHNLTDVHGQTHSAAVRKTHLCFIYVEGRI